MPYTIIAFPLVFLLRARGCGRSRSVHGYVTPADFVRARFGSPLLALLIAITGIVATMPYIALQLAGIEAVLRTIGLNGNGFWGHPPLFIAFVVLAAYTYQSGLRAPALIAVVKDLLIYIVIIVAIIYLPLKLGGWGPIFGAAPGEALPPSPSTGQPSGRSCCRRTTSSSTPRSRSAPRWRCSSTRTRSPACSPARAAARSGATWPPCRPTRSCWP